MNNNNFVLYLHVVPNGKKYFGITGQRPKQRWIRGKGYKTQRFYEAVEEFGWDNIGHYILADDLTENEASFFEKVMIALYDTTNPNNGYNDSHGNGLPSERARQKMRDNHRDINGENNPNYGKTGRDNHRSKTVICITTGRCFGSACEAARWLGINNGKHISNCCTGKKFFAYRLPDGTRLVWKYVQDLPKPQLTELDKEHLRHILNKYSA